MSWRTVALLLLLGPFLGLPGGEAQAIPALPAHGFPTPLAFDPAISAPSDPVLPASPMVAMPPTSPHPPILATAVAGQTVGAGIRSGSGSPADPYVISGWEVDLRPLSPSAPSTSAYLVRDAITVRDTNAHFLVTANVVRGAPGVGILVSNAPNVRVEGNVVEVDNAALAPDYAASGVRPVGVHLLAGGASVRYNTITIENAGHRAAVGIRLTVSAADVVGNTVRNEALGLLFFEGILAESPAGARIVSNDVVNAGSATSLAGIRARDGRVTIRDNDVTGASAASASISIEALRCSFSTVEANRVVGGQTGILVTDGSGNLVRANDVRSAALGLIVQRERGDAIEGNVLASNLYGFGLYGTDDTHFLHTVAASNTVNARPVVVLSGLRDTVVEAPTYGVVGFFGILNARNVTVRNVSVTGSVQGLLLGDFDNGRAEDISVPGNWRGVDLSASYASRITRVVGTSVAVVGGAASRVDNATLTGGGDVPPGLYGRGIGSYGLLLTDGAAYLTASHLSISGAGVAVFGYRTKGLTLTASLLVANGYAGFFDSTTADIHRGNSIHSNTRPFDGAATRADARLNWWGSAAGPVGVDTRQFTLDPWLTSAPTGVGDQH